MSPVPTTSTFSGALGSVGGRHDDDGDDDEAEEAAEAEEADEADETPAPVHCASSDGVKPHIWLVPMPSISQRARNARSADLNVFGLKSKNKFRNGPLHAVDAIQFRPAVLQEILQHNLLNAEQSAVNCHCPQLPPRYSSS